MVPLVTALLLGLLGPDALAQAPPAKDTPAKDTPAKDTPAKDTPTPGEAKAADAPRAAAGSDLPGADDSMLQGTRDSYFPPAPVGIVDILGRLHPLVVHFPLAWLALLLLVDLGTFFLGFKEWLRAGALLLFAAVVSCVPALLTGLVREAYVTGFFKSQLVPLHRNLMVALSGVLLVAFLIRLRSRNRLEGAAATAYLALLMMALLFTILGGHFGAKMVFGPRYLPF